MPKDPPGFAQRVWNVTPIISSDTTSVQAGTPFLKGVSVEFAGYVRFLTVGGNDVEYYASGPTMYHIEIERVIIAAGSPAATGIKGYN